MVFHRSHLITFCLLVLMPYAAASITFDFPENGPDNHRIWDIVTEGDASISDSVIQLTRNGTGSGHDIGAGRATYVRPFHLWDNRSNKLANFSTSFKFVIDSNRTMEHGDGLTFFLAQKNSVICPGGAMGLPVNLTTLNATNRFVAVEFDTFSNWWDPRDSNNDSIGNHVGISISSLISVRNQIWFGNISGGGVCEALITYNSVSRNLSVSLTDLQWDVPVPQRLEYTVDLRKELPEWVIFGFSGATGMQFEKNTVRSWSFKGSDLQVDENNRLPPGHNKSKVGLVVGLLISVAFLAVFGIVIICWRNKKKSRKDEEELRLNMEMNNEFETGTGPKRFSYRELARSTSDFSENEKLGEGGFGGVYRGFLKDSTTYIAVKKVSKSSKQGIKEYASEVKIISRLRHKNLVQLLGWCHEKGNLLLIYEFMENGSLDSHLFMEKSLLTWGTRYKIAYGLASALLYLHEEWEQCVLHRDIKSSNIMLDSNFNAKLGDFGLAKLVAHEKGSQTTMLAGTLGYMAPECVVTGKASKESDVFSFGVVALEIACGRKPIEYRAPEKQIRLVQWVWELYGSGTLLEAADPRLGLDFEEEEIKRLMILGLWCVHPGPDFRPSMRQVVQVLNSEASLPMLPSKIPVASYLTPALSPLHGVTSIVLNQSSSSVFNTDSSKQTSSTDQDLRSPSCSTSKFHSTGRSKDSEYPIMPCQSGL